MDAETVAPCRHPGAPPEDVVELVVSAIRAISADAEFLNRSGLTAGDFEFALPAAIEKVRGSAAASNADRRTFLISIFDFLKALGVISEYEKPKYGSDTVYKLLVPDLGPVAIIQKGCPDGAHSSVNWNLPDWAEETYLWWLCDSFKCEPGGHVAKGINRLRSRFFDQSYSDAVDGIIFHNAVCGTAMRPCPKIEQAIVIDGKKIPPPCVWIMPERKNFMAAGSNEWNWSGERKRRFPAILIEAFGIQRPNTANYLGHVGFSRTARGARTSISSRYGLGRSTTYRSDPR